MTPESGERRNDLKSNLLERLHDPIQLRIFVMAAVFAVGYIAIYTPLNEQIAKATQTISRDRKLLEVAKSLEKLQKQYEAIEPRVPQQTTTDQWVQYMLEGTRKFHDMRVLNFKCRAPQGLGPYKVIVFDIDLEGSFSELNRFLTWLETDKRLFRVDDLKIAPSNNESGPSDVVVMKIQVLGMAG